MWKVGIVGTENSHARKFLSCFQSPNPKSGAVPFPDIAVIALLEDSPNAKALAKDFPSVKLFTDIQELAEFVDAVLITSRRGSQHMADALPFIKAGKAIYIDKPFTSDPEEAELLAQLLCEHNCKVLTGSNCKFSKSILDAAKQAGDLIEKGTLLSADLSFCYYPDSIYDGFYFYAPHLVEICMAIFGSRILSVQAAESAHALTATLQYAAFSVTLHFLEDFWYPSCTLYHTDGCLHFPLNTADGIAQEAAAFAQLLADERPSMTKSEMVQPVQIIHAILKAVKSGATVPFQM